MVFPIILLYYKKLSEGVVIKRADSIYGAPQNKAWAKPKREYEIDGVILQRNQTKVPTVFNHGPGIGPIAAEYGKAIGDKARKHDDRWYMFIGTSGSARFMAVHFGCSVSAASSDILAL